MVYQLLKDHPMLTSREIYQALDRRGSHLCRSYILRLMRAAHLKRAQEINTNTEDFEARTRPSEARYILRNILEEGEREIRQVERRVRRRLREYAKRWLI